MTIKLRYKKPDENLSRLIEEPVADAFVNWENASDNFRFSAAVAEFGFLLRQSPFVQNGNYQQVRALAKSAIGADPNGYRTEFLQLVEAAQTLTKNVVKNKGTQ